MDFPLGLKVSMSGFLVTFVAVSTLWVTRGRPPGVLFAVVGVFATLLGACLAGNIHRSAELYGRWVAGRGLLTLGVGSLFANVWFVRAFGVAFAVAGVAFAVAGFASPG
jgi:hypothetical protein